MKEDAVRDQIKHNRIYIDLKKEAKEAERKQLEDYYLQKEYLEETDSKVSSYWQLTAILFIIITIISTLALYSLSISFPHSEATNYETLGDEICFQQGMEPYRYIEIHDRNTIIHCGREKYEVFRK